ncbi:MAG: aminopeptidase [Aminipila sp.]
MTNNKKEKAKDENKILKRYGWQGAGDKQKKEILFFADAYMDFLDKAKTEREAVKELVELAEQAGFVDISSKNELKTGDKVYSVNKSKSLFMSVVGSEPLTEGVNLVGSHIDAPRLDLKQNPLYEDSGLALLKTHYYGGIKKYQWTTIPLALHGVVAKTDGTVVDINIGEDPEDPIFIITDLLPHLSTKQNAKKLSDGITAENLNIVVGSMPLVDGDEELAKSQILEILKEKYGICENDFRSAELEAVPAAKAKSLGLDKSMVAAYGQDDRVCAYASLRAMLNMETPSRTAVCIFADKEEIGSMGNTGMHSQNFELFMMELLEKTGIVHPYAVQRVFSNTKALSADVTAAYDPTYPEVMEKYNSSFMGKGITIKKYTGARGKSGASDANAEFVGYVRSVFEAAGVNYQSSEMGKVDEGGGGTIAYILANRGMEVLDCGVPIHSMHSPYESASKYDIYMAYLGYKAFLEK